MGRGVFGRDPKLVLGGTLSSSCRVSIVCDSTRCRDIAFVPIHDGGCREIWRVDCRNRPGFAASTDAAFTSPLELAGVAISMDGQIGGVWRTDAAALEAGWGTRQQRCALGIPSIAYNSRH